MLFDDSDDDEFEAVLARARGSCVIKPRASPSSTSGRTSQNGERPQLKVIANPNHELGIVLPARPTRDIPVSIGQEIAAATQRRPQQSPVANVETASQESHTPRRRHPREVLLDSSSDEELLDLRRSLGIARSRALQNGKKMESNTLDDSRGEACSLEPGLSSSPGSSTRNPTSILSGYIPSMNASRRKSSNGNTSSPQASSSTSQPTRALRTKQFLEYTIGGGSETDDDDYNRHGTDSDRKNSQTSRDDRSRCDYKGSPISNDLTPRKSRSRKERFVLADEELDRELDKWRPPSAKRRRAREDASPHADARLQPKTRGTDVLTGHKRGRKPDSSPALKTNIHSDIETKLKEKREEQERRRQLREKYRHRGKARSQDSPPLFLIDSVEFGTTEERPQLAKPLHEDLKVPYVLGLFTPDLPQQSLELASSIQDSISRLEQDSDARQGKRRTRSKIAQEEEVYKMVTTLSSLNNTHWANYKQIRHSRSLKVPSLVDLCLQRIKDEPTLESSFQTCRGQFAELGATDAYDMFARQLHPLKRRAFIPATANRYLMPYQRDGVQFLFDVYSGMVSPGMVTRGGILADVMGLGKTIQVVCFLLAIFHKTGTAQDEAMCRRRLYVQEEASRFLREGGPGLLVVPVSVVDNWANELERWGHFTVENLSGCSRDLVEKKILRAKDGKVDLVLVGYERMRDLVTENEHFASITWRVVVFDECHRLKNPVTGNSLKARLLKSACKLGATGTPVSNRVNELWGIMHVLAPCELGPQRTFDKYVARPLNRGRLQSATGEDMRREQAVRKKLSFILERLILRRGKEVIADRLSGKKDTMVLCPLTPLQEQVYLRVLNSPDFIKLLAAVRKSSVVDRDIPASDKELSIPANNVKESGPVDQSIDFDAPLWRMQHRIHFKNQETKNSTVGTLQFSINEVDTIENDVVQELIGDEDDNDREEPGKAAKESASNDLIKAQKMISLPKHDSSDEESSDERDSTSGKVMHKFAPCRMCPKCIQMPAVVLLAQIANHLDLVRADPGEENPVVRHKQLRKARYILGPFAKRPEGILETLSPAIRNSDVESHTPVDDYYQSRRWEHLIDETQCGKMLVLRQLLQRWRAKGGIKVLIFSNSLVLLDVLESYIQSLAYPYLRLDGSTVQSLRQKMCRQFNADPLQFIFLMSTRAGGEGLNLTGASKVVIFDPDWSPTPDLQAQDRAHRLGQQQFVRVYRLISQGTVEEAKYLRQVDKRQAAASILDDSHEKRLFKDNEFRGMVELLRYSRESFTKSINQRYISERAKYVKASKGVTIQGKLVKYTDGEDVNEKDNFVMYDLNPMHLCGEISPAPTNLTVNSHGTRSGSGKVDKQHEAPKRAAVTNSVDSTFAESGMLVNRELHTRCLRQDSNLRDGGEEDELEVITEQQVNWDSLVGDSREEREYAADRLDNMQRRTGDFREKIKD